MKVLSCMMCEVTRDCDWVICLVRWGIITIYSHGLKVSSKIGRDFTSKDHLNTIFGNGMRWDDGLWSHGGGLEPWPYLVMKETEPYKRSQKSAQGRALPMMTADRMLVDTTSSTVQYWVHHVSMTVDYSECCLIWILSHLSPSHPSDV